MLLERTKKRGRRLGWMENYVGWLYCLPIIVGILTFTLVPIILSLYSTVLQWDGFGSIFDAKNIGAANFKNIFSSHGIQLWRKMFWQSLGNTFWMMLQIPISMLLGVLLALGMNRKMHGAKVFRVLYYLPCITSVVAITILFQRLFAYDGTINQLLGKLHIGKKNWLTDDVLVKVTVNILILWKGVGYSALMYLAGLQSVSTDQIEAAKIDGATSSKIFLKITLPALYPITFYLLVTGIMGGLQIFNEPYILVQYGIANNAMTSASFIYYFYMNRNLGMAAVGAWMLALLVFIVTFIQVAIDNRKEKY